MSRKPVKSTIFIFAKAKNKVTVLHTSENAPMTCFNATAIGGATIGISIGIYDGKLFAAESIKKYPN